MFHIIKLIFEIINGSARYAAKNQAPPTLPSNLYTRKATSTLKYIEIATNARIHEQKSVDEVKIMLLNRGLPEDHLDIILDKAERNYKNWFNDTDGKSAPTALELYQQLTQTPIAPKQVVEIIGYKGEDHALHFSALIGFKRYMELNGRALLLNTVKKALSTPAAITAGQTIICQSDLSGGHGKANPAMLRVVTIDGQNEAIYPYLYTENRTGFNTQKIVEWENGDPIVEAEIKGQLNSTTPLCFFATDYAVNKQTYQSQKDIEIKLSAFVLELVKSEKSADDLANQPGNIRINKNYRSPSYFSFEGTIVEIKGASIDATTLSCVMKLNLGKGALLGSNLVIDAYVTNTGIKTDKIQAGMVVKGILWFQGEIAS